MLFVVLGLLAQCLLISVAAEKIRTKLTRTMVSAFYF